jgi:hypothetical protein
MRRCQVPTQGYDNSSLARYLHYLTRVTACQLCQEMQHGTATEREGELAEDADDSLNDRHLASSAKIVQRHHSTINTLARGSGNASN